MSHHTRPGWPHTIRRYLPPTNYLVTAGLLLATVEGFWFAAWQFVGQSESLDNFLKIRDATVLVVLVSYGIYRVRAFHPLFLREYATWLDRTPWQPGLPLPLGPVHLVWADLVIAGGLALLLEDPREFLDQNSSRLSSVAGFMTFLQAHATMVAIAVWLSRPRHLAYVTLFLLALGARLSLWSPVAGFIVLTAGVITAHAGLKQSWSQFPWVETSDWLSRLKTGWKAMQAQSSQGGFSEDPAPDRVPPSQLGWPFGVCSPYVTPVMVSTREKLLLSALFGFWTHTLLAPLPAEAVEMVSIGILGYGAVIAAVTNLSKFGGNHYPPINLVGRLLTIRWVIPGYDAVIIAPLSILVIPAITGGAGHFWLAVPLPILTPLVLTLMLWTACLIGPSPPDWRLTAPARLVPGRLNRNQFEELS